MSSNIDPPSIHIHTSQPVPPVIGVSFPSSTTTSGLTSTAVPQTSVPPRQSQRTSHTTHDIDPDTDIDDSAPRSSIPVTTASTAPVNQLDSDDDMPTDAPTTSARVDVTQADVTSPDWPGFCDMVSRCPSFQSALSLIQSNRTLMTRLRSTYNGRGVRNITTLYQSLLESLGMPFPLVKFEPLRSGLTPGGAYHLFLQRLLGLKSEQEQRSARAFVDMVLQQPTKPHEWQHHIDYEHISSMQHDTQPQAPTRDTDAPQPRRTRSTVPSPSRRQSTRSAAAAPDTSSVRRSLSGNMRSRSVPVVEDVSSDSDTPDDMDTSPAPVRSSSTRPRDDVINDLSRAVHGLVSRLDSIVPPGSGMVQTGSVGGNDLTERLARQVGYPSVPARHVAFQDDIPLTVPPASSVSNPTPLPSYVNPSRPLPTVAGDALAESLLGPVMVARAGGNFCHWFDKVAWRLDRNKHEASTLCYLLDEMPRYGVPVHSSMFERAARRLGAVYYGDKFNNWDLASVIADGHGEGGDLLPLGIIHNYATHVTQANQLHRRAANTNQTQAAPYAPLFPTPYASPTQPNTIPFTPQQQIATQGIPYNNNRSYGAGANNNTRWRGGRARNVPIAPTTTTTTTTSGAATPGGSSNPQ